MMDNRPDSGRLFVAEERIRLDAEYREAILSWLRANDIDPANVPHWVHPTISDGQITLEMWTLNERGERQWDVNSDQLARHTVTVPLLVPPTPEVKLWLAPRCETCGR